ncbi:MAG: FAD-binding oxidoreductase [Gammaproteobacteria bacterium]|nr:MAG: FAD-binding oxidoreductase [Gammaproteobacteria bacterium]
MRRWNGWGDENTSLALPEAGKEFLESRIGLGVRLDDATLEAVVSKVPESRLPAHPGVDRSPETRVRHARGQSLPDWLAMRSGAFEVFPDGVAFPESSEEVAELLNWCDTHDVVVIPYGGGTSVAGHINPLASERPVLTLSLARMNQLMELDEVSHIATFGAGTPGPMVEAQLRARGYTLGHFPQSWELSTIGGWVASRSSGQQSLRYGRIEQLFIGGRVETLKGTLELPPIPASSAGPDVRELILGSEGRLGVITEVKVKVTPLPEHEDFYVVFFPDWERARNASRALVQARVPLSMLRLSNAVETETQLALAGHPSQIALLEKYLSVRGAGHGKCMMTFGVTGTRLQCRQALSQTRRTLKPFEPVHTGKLLGRKWKAKRFLMPYLRESLWEAGYAVDTLETCTPWSNVDRLLNLIEQNLRTVLEDEGGRVHVFTHLSHFYPQGCSIYTTYVFPNAGSYEETLARWVRLKTTTSELIVKHGGTISHQHGVGKDHAPYLKTEKGPVAISMLEQVTRHMDAHQRLNPGTLLIDSTETARTSGHAEME